MTKRALEPDISYNKRARIERMKRHATAAAMVLDVRSLNPTASTEIASHIAEQQALDNLRLRRELHDAEQRLWLVNDMWRECLHNHYALRAENAELHRLVQQLKSTTYYQPPTTRTC